MCLLVFAWKRHPRYRLIFAGNRDEFHERPAAPLQWWKEPPHQNILAGRDLQAGGTWLGLSRNGAFGVVTNYRDMQRPLQGAPSRGDLLTQWLTSHQTPREFAAGIAPRAREYAGFNLLIAGTGSDTDEMLYAANRAPQFARVLEPGVYGLSNHLLDTPWPKLARTRTRFERFVAQFEPSLDDLEHMLADREPAPDADLPATGLPRERERLVSAPFIVDAQYGTRCTTVVMIGNDGHAVVRERRFDATGRSVGMEEISFAPTRPSVDAPRG